MGSVATLRKYASGDPYDIVLPYRHLCFMQLSLHYMADFKHQGIRRMQPHHRGLFLVCKSEPHVHCDERERLSSKLLEAYARSSNGLHIIAWMGLVAFHSDIVQRELEATMRIVVYVAMKLFAIQWDGCSIGRWHRLDDTMLMQRCPTHLTSTRRHEAQTAVHIQTPRQSPSPRSTPLLALPHHIPLVAPVGVATPASQHV